MDSVDVMVAELIRLREACDTWRSYAGALEERLDAADTPYGDLEEEYFGEGQGE